MSTSTATSAPSDEFDIIVDYKRAATGESEVGELLYAGLERDGKPQHAADALGQRRRSMVRSLRRRRDSAAA